MKMLKKVGLIAFLLITMFSTNVFATDLSCGSITDSAKQFEKVGADAASNALKNDANIVTEMTKPVAQVTQILATVGVLVIGCCFVILGIQWTMAKPSPEAQAKLKDRFVGLIITSGVLFGGYSIWKIIITIFSNIF